MRKTLEFRLLGMILSASLPLGGNELVRSWRAWPPAVRSASAVAAVLLLVCAGAPITAQAQGNEQPTEQQEQSTPDQPQPEAQARPTNLTATLSSDGVRLTWQAPKDDADSVTGYRISRRWVQKFTTRWKVLLENSGNTETTYVDAAADEPGAHFLYQVAAQRGSSPSKASNIAEVTIPVPPRPSELRAIATPEGIMLSWHAGHLSWQASALPFSGYRITRIEERSRSNPRPMWETLVENTGSLRTTFLDQTGFEDVQYRYAVRAVHGFVRSHWQGIAGPAAGHLSRDSSSSGSGDSSAP